MYARCVLLLACCAIPSTASASIVTYDFADLQQLPGWLTVEFGHFYPESQISNDSSSEGWGRLLVGFNLDRPFRLKSVDIWAEDGAVEAWLVGFTCDHNYPYYIPAPWPEGFGHADYNCAAPLGRGQWSIEWTSWDSINDTYAEAALLGFTLEYLPEVAGDTNDDFVVDLSDLNNVRNNFGVSGGHPIGDANLDGSVDLNDLNLVRNHFGNSGVVSEPSSLLLLLAGLTGFRILRTSRFRSR